MAAEVGTLREALDKVQAENDLLRTRLLRLEPHRRPYYRPWERLAILAQMARYRLSAEATGRTFVVARTSVQNWLKAVKVGIDRLVCGREPINKLPDLVRELSCFLKGQWPSWGSRRIAGVLARLGLKASRTSVQRALRRPPPPRRKKPLPRSRTGTLPRAKRPRHVCVVDFTVLGGVFRSVVIAAVIDLLSRKVLALRAFLRLPDAAAAGAVLQRAIRDFGKPAWVLSDHGPQFISHRFRSMLRRRGIGRRFGVAGRPGLPGIDRWFRSLKVEFARALFLFRPLRSIERDLANYLVWFNGFRPHSSLKSLSPDEVFLGKPPRPVRRVEHATLRVRFVGNNRKLPIFSLRPAG